MPTGLLTRYEFDANLQRSKPYQNKSIRFENMAMSYFQRFKSDWRIKWYCTTRTQEKIDWSNAERFCGHCNTVFEEMGCFYHYSPCQEARPAPTEEDIQHGTKKTEIDEMPKQYIEEKS